MLRQKNDKVHLIIFLFINFLPVSKTTLCTKYSARSDGKWCVFVAVCVIRYEVVAIQRQIKSMKFARCPRKCFCFRESFNTNNSITINKVKAKVEISTTF